MKCWDVCGAGAVCVDGVLSVFIGRLWVLGTQYWLEQLKVRLIGFGVFSALFSFI